MDPASDPTSDGAGRKTAGWEQSVWTGRVESALGASLPPDALPLGFEALQVPSAADVAAALELLQPRGRDAPDATPVAIHPGRPVVVIDIETSGLGRTIVPFMVAAAWHERRGRSVRLEQWTLRDPRDERGFLRAVFTRLDRVVTPGTRLLSYNGASFDLPRLRARASRLHLEWDSDPAGTMETYRAAHLDLVHPARRVLKDSLPNCRLGTIEAAVLGVKRRGDISGEGIADLWTRLAAVPRESEASNWLREELARAQVHNRGDVFALFAVATAVAERLVAPQSLAEAVGAARHLVHCGQTARARELLNEGVEAGPGRSGASTWVEAALMLADLHRAEGHYEHAACVWQTVCDVAPGNVRAHEGLAKHLEHRACQPVEALAVARASAAPCSKRIARLQKKASAKATRVDNGPARSA